MQKPSKTARALPRRGVLVGLAAAAPVAAIASLPTAATAATATRLDGTKVSQELRDLVRTLQDADEALTAAQATFDAEYGLYQEWLKQNPEPTGKSRRAMRRWFLRQERYIEGSSFHSAQAAQMDAVRAHEAACKAIAEYRARDMNELVHIACLACVFEDGGKASPRIATSDRAREIRRCAYGTAACEGRQAVDAAAEDERPVRHSIAGGTDGRA